ncbi:hypothetical protein ABT061_35750 [Streptosporangium sp. NPDC002544]|uniref:hypothetical protein n=1 Tax=Streptosporangium sp. NPDC002544 TaxID=3154538 RepID=UPI00332380AF
MPRNVLTSTACAALALIVTAGCATAPRPSTTALAPPVGRNADDGAADRGRPFDPTNIADLNN